MSNIVDQVIILFLLLVVGFYARKRGFIDERVNRGLSDLLLNVTMPLLVLVSFLRPFEKAMLGRAGEMLALSILMNILLLLLGKAMFFKAPQHRQAPWRFITAFSNCGFMGIPLLASLFPDVGVFFGAVFQLPFWVFMFSSGITLFTGKTRFKDMWKAVMNPILMATLAGIVLYLCSVPFPRPVTQTMTMVGNMTTPLSMMIIGAMLAEVKAKEVFSGVSIYMISAVRLLLAPALTFLVCRLFHADPVITRILVVIEALPSAATVAVFSQIYGGDNAYTSRCVFLSTALSLLTLPLVVRLLDCF
ncbi:AEC family transporter [Holophaga foetida]|uniref:AEC family transporter n=1 Tax=Holophaga foetida TaxID=35839 RepID=UPI000247496F|nr:AEC family transporter [Holophaga foetida]